MYTGLIKSNNNIEYTSVFKFVWWTSWKDLQKRLFLFVVFMYHTFQSILHRKKQRSESKCLKTNKLFLFLCSVRILRA